MSIISEPLMKIYTKRGDSGFTHLSDGTEVSKNDCCIEACGALDELNSHVGLLVALLSEESSRSQSAVIGQLHEVQRRLFVIGSALSGASLSVSLSDIEALSAIEAAIDRLQSHLPPWRGFVLPGGCRSAAQAHVCRSVCRRVERCVVSAGGEEYLSYLNRLSDFFFLLALFLNQIKGFCEIKW
mgnify:FL=1